MGSDLGPDSGHETGPTFGAEIGFKSVLIGCPLACLTTRLWNGLRIPDLELRKLRMPAAAPAAGKGSIGYESGISSVAVQGH